jgi:tetratricopeptide (TPR) repeat protein
MKFTKLSKNKVNSLIFGSILLCITYLGYLIIAAKIGFASAMNSLIATIVFVVTYTLFFYITTNPDKAFLKKHKNSILNTSFLFIPLILAIICYVLTKNFFATLLVFIVGQIAYTIYYKHYVPVPGYNRAYRFYKRGDLKNACIILNHILERYPESYETLVLLSTIKIKQTHYQDAIELLLKAIEVKPDSVLVYLNLSHAYTAVEDFDKTIEMAKKLLELNPTIWSPHYSIALSSLFSGNYSKAIEHFKKVLEFDLPESQIFLVHYGLARAYDENREDLKAQTEYNNTRKFATNKALNYWKQQLTLIGDYKNKPSILVKEAYEFASNGEEE